MLKLVNVTNMWRPWSRTENAESEVLADISANQRNDAPEGNVHCVRSHLSIDTQQIILSVYNTLKSEDYGTKTATIARTSKLTGISYGTVHKIVQNGGFNRKVRNDKGISKQINNFDTVRRVIYQFYKRNEIPTLQNLSNFLKETHRLQCSVSTLSRALRKNGFKFCTINKRQTIMESPRLQLLRDEYLTKIKAFREQKRFICYLDETWYDTHDTVKKGWNDDSDFCSVNVPVSRGKRIIIAHAGSVDGWVGSVLLSAKNIKSSCVDYHQDMTASLFEEWFVHKLLPSLPKESVIVMDNASYHSRQVVKIPNAASTKLEISKFLEENDLYFEENYSKKQLLEVLYTKKFEKQYYIDNIAADQGHTVLRLPPYYCVLNPIELIWSSLKEKIRRKNTSPKCNEATVNMIHETIPLITPDTWKNCIEHVIGIENQYLEYTNSIQRFVIHLSESETSDSDDFGDI